MTRNKKIVGFCCLMASLVLPSALAAAAEKGLIIRAGDLMSEPFIDAAKSAKLAANQPVDIVERKGAWVRVQANAQTGWVRTLNLRLPQSGAVASSASSSGSSLSILRTGSTGKTVTTGVKGLGEEDIRNASPNYAALDELGSLSVDASDARANAQRSGLKENQVDYLNSKEKRK